MEAEREACLPTEGTNLKALGKLTKSHKQTQNNRPSTVHQTHSWLLGKPQDKEKKEKSKWPQKPPLNPWGQGLHP